MEPPRFAEFSTLLQVLDDAGVEFIVVGGYASIVHGGPLPTFDLDIVRRHTPANSARILKVLEQIDACTRNDSRRLRFDATHLAAPGTLLMATRFGPMDILASLHDGRTYDDLLDHTELFQIAGRAVRVLDLPTLIEVKAAAGRDKDRIVVQHLTAILRSREAD